MNVESTEILLRGAPRPARLHLPDGEPRGVVELVHGSAYGDENGFAEYARALAGYGVAALVVAKVMDGYGPVRRRYGLLADDAVEAIAWARCRLPGLPVTLLGYSEGSWVALAAALRTRIDRLVLCSSPLVTPAEQTGFHWAGEHPAWTRPLREIGRLAVQAAMTLTDYGRHDPRHAITAVRAPILLVLGGEDRTLDVPRAARVLESHARAPHRVIVVPGAGHGLPADGDWLRAVAEP